MKKKLMKDFLYILVGNAILCFAVAYFIIPNNVLTGGLAGIAIILKPFVSIGTSTLINILVVALFLLGFVFLGKKFAMTTIFSSILYPVILTFFTKYLVVTTVDAVYAAIYGGLIAGIGVGLVMRVGASTGGMDIPPLILHKYTNLPISTLVFCIDFVTVLGGLFVYGLQPTLIGLFSVAATSYAIKTILTFGGKNLKSVQVISERYLEISKEIITQLDRTTTIMDAHGGFSEEEKKVLLVVIDINQYNNLIRIIDEIDNKAFVIVSDVNDVHGEGFTYGFRV
jgi:uncharacterized membrane-anchored protein YitT (DUF2179 family)